jgi:hypothetical protein
VSFPQLSTLDGSGTRPHRAPPVEKISYEEMVEALSDAFHDVNPLRYPKKARALFEIYLFLLSHEGQIREQ